MKQQGLRKGVMLALVAFAGLTVASWQASAGRIAIQFYGNLGTGTPEIPGVTVEDLTSASNFPDNPAAVSGGQLGLPFLTEGLQWPTPFEEGDFANNYGTMAEGYISVPTAGEWKFFVRSDDGSRFELNTSGPSSDGATPIAEVPGDDCCDPYVDDGVRSSDPIELEPGTHYYFRMLHKEATGGDWWQVGWQGPNMDEPQTIGSRFIQEFVAEDDVLEVVQGPQDTTVQETDPLAAFGVTVRASPSVEYQWMRNGEAIDGATNPFLNFQASLDNDGDTFSVEITNGAGQSTTTSAATLTVEPDTTSPKVSTVSPRGDPNGVNVFFSEPVSESTALNADNYSIDGGDVGIESVEFFAGNTQRVRLNTSGSGFEVGSRHTVEISDVEDRASEPNVVDPNPTSTEFVFGRKAPDAAWLFNEGSGDIAQPFAGDRTGSLDNGASFDSDSPFPDESGSVTFDGEDDVIDFGDLTFNGAEEFSMSMWIKAASTGMDRGFFEFVDSGGADAWGIGYDSEGATGGGVEGLKVGITTSESPTPNETDDQQESMENIQTTDWQHIVWTWEDGEGFNLYIDGELDEPVSPMSRTEGALAMMEFFRLGDGRKAHWQGQIGETAIWDGAVLTAEQVQMLSNQSVTANGESWPLREVGPVEITQQPESQTVTEPATASLSVEVGGATPRFFQWHADGEPIEGATSRTYTTSELLPEDSGTTYTVVVSNEFSQVTSAEAVVTVEEDTTAPTVTDTSGVFGASTSDILSGVRLTFNEEVTQETAENPDNYTLEPATEVTGARLLEDNMTVELETGEQQQGTRYTVTIDGVEDRASTPNVVSGATADFVSWTQETGGFHRYFYPDVSGASLDTEFYTPPSERDNPAQVPAGFAPLGEDPGSNSTIIDIFESGRDVADGYHAIMRGWLVPPQDGDYTFYLSADDQAQLWLSTDEDPANATQIASEPEWNGSRDWTGTERRGQEQNISDPIELTAGDPVYVEAVFAEGGGGDGMEVTWQAPGQEVPENGSPSRIQAEHMQATLPTSMTAAPWSVTITQPEDLSTMAVGDVELTSEISDLGDATIESVTYYVDGEPIGDVTSSPYTLTWQATQGVHTIRAEVVDTVGRTGSDEVEVAVGDVGPQLVSAGTKSGSGQVGVVFNKQVTEASATETGNYTIEGATITGASIDEAGRSVTLEVDGLPDGDFSVTVNGVEDKFGIGVPSDSQASVATPTMENQDIGTDLGTEEADPLVEGSAQFFGDGNWDVTAGGSDIWGADDSFHFVYEEISGDFDKSVRVQELTMAGSTWAKGGLMARVNAEPGSRHVMNIVTPPEGEDIYVGQERLETDGESQRWDGDGDNGSPGVPLPNAWVRLKREGDTFLAYRSTDGQNWTQTDEVTRSDLPSDLLVGMALTSHDNSEEGTVLAQFRSYGDAEVQQGPVPVTISLEAGTVTIEYESGGLETAPSVTGPWTESDQGSPATFPVDAQAAQFFRVLR